MSPLMIYLLAAAIGIAVGVMIWYGVRSAHNTIRYNDEATEYVVKGSVKFRRKHERYLYTKHNKRPREKKE